MSTVPNPPPRYSKIPAYQYKQLPPRPSLEHLKEQAKDLLRDFLAGKKDALRRVRRFMPQALNPQPQENRFSRPALKLKDAQNILAREYAGCWKFTSWEDLKIHVEAVNHCSDATIIEQIDELKHGHHWPGKLNPHRFLGSVGVRALPHFIHAVKHHPSARVRFECLNFLDHLDFPVNEEFVEAVAGALSDSAPKVRRMAVHALCCARCKSVPAALSEEHLRQIGKMSVCDESSRFRFHAAHTICSIAGTAAVQTIRAELLRQSAVQGDIGERARKLLEDLARAEEKAASQKNKKR